MTVIADTLQAKKRLLEAGFSDEKAEGIVAIFQSADAQIATKMDLELFRKDTKASIDALRKDVDGLRKEMKADMDALRKDLTIKLGGMLVVSAGLILGVLTLILTRLPAA